MSAPSLPLRVSTCSYFRLECGHEQLFHSEYKRSNRTRGLKILRCFPHCCPEHIDRSYCGSSLSVKIRLAERPVGSAPFQPPPSELLAVFARFEVVNDVSLRPGECVEVDKLQEGVQTETNLDGQWIAGVLDRPSGLMVTIRGSDTALDEEKPVVFHLNKAHKAFTENDVMECVAVDMDDNFTTISSREAYTQLYRVLHAVSSPEFTVISYRRAPLDQLQAAQAHAASQLATQQSASPSTQRATGVSRQMLPQSVYSPAHNASVVPIAHARDVSQGSGRSSSRLGSLLRENPLNEAKRQRRIPPTRSSDQGMIHPLQDKLIWEHVNAPAVAVSQNMALLLAFVRWTPVRLYASQVDEVVNSIKLKLLDTSRTTPKKDNLDCFSRLIFQHAQVEESVRAAGSGPLPLELETLLRVASQTVLWLLSHETLGWFREFFRLNAALILDKKAIRSCFIQFLLELEDHLNAEVFAAFHPAQLGQRGRADLKRPKLRWVEHSLDRKATFKMAFPSHNPVERNWNGEWLLDTDDVQWDINEASSSLGRKMDADPRVPDVSLFSMVEMMTQIVRVEVAIDV
ncbi:hypothetical protein GN244_ATG02617 [Phytophthora infestans]|uniref:Uncharacterized protein n=1 Tax=Phytophthora infestans TaxID=4787 RepID=A0A833T8E1_PHYIN|nr:hypothetical protein GN244_ATG02617 [Phytophthora infestans]